MGRSFKYGSPARVIGIRIPEETYQKLLELSQRMFGGDKGRTIQYLIDNTEITIKVPDPAPSFHKIPVPRSAPRIGSLVGRTATRSSEITISEDRRELDPFGQVIVKKDNRKSIVSTGGLSNDDQKD